MSASFISLASLLFVAAITPGPNNFIILGLSLNKGASATLLPISAILLGTQFVLLMTDLGMHLILSTMPGLQFSLMLIGCGYLGWSGIKMILHRNIAQFPSTESKSLLGLLMFQVVNPKSWLLVGTAYTSFKATAMQQTDHSLYWVLSLLILVIPFGCLVLWAGTGHFLKTRLNPQLSARYAMPSLGLVLLLSVASLLGMALEGK